jgi:hypothetical protein
MTSFTAWAPVPADYEQRLSWRVRVCAEDAATCALTLLERQDPATLGDAVALVCPDGRPTSEAFDTIAEAWERYRHMRDMAWD